jgi:hypothetical protein
MKNRARRGGHVRHRETGADGWTAKKNGKRKRETHSQLGRDGGLRRRLGAAGRVVARGRLPQRGQGGLGRRAGDGLAAVARPAAAAVARPVLGAAMDGRLPGKAQSALVQAARALVGRPLGRVVLVFRLKGVRVFACVVFEVWVSERVVREMKEKREEQTRRLASPPSHTNQKTKTHRVRRRPDEDAAPRRPVDDEAGQGHARDDGAHVPEAGLGGGFCV